MLFIHTTSFEEQPLNDRTLSRFRARVLAYETEHDVDLIHECIVKMAKEIAEFMRIPPTIHRMDSLMITANIKNLSLLKLFYTCVASLAKIMNQREIALLEEQCHYIEKADYSKYQLLICLLKERTTIDDDRTRRLQKKKKLKIRLKFYEIHPIRKLLFNTKPMKKT